MKIEKYMLETAKAMLKEKNVMLWEYEDSIVVSNDGYFAMFVPREKFIFNAEPHGTFMGKLPRNWECNEIRYTDVCEQHGKKLCRVLEPVSGKWKIAVVKTANLGKECYALLLETHTKRKQCEPQTECTVICCKMALWACVAKLVNVSIWSRNICFRGTNSIKSTLPKNWEMWLGIWQ